MVDNPIIIVAKDKFQKALKDFPKELKPTDEFKFIAGFLAGVSYLGWLMSQPDVAMKALVEDIERREKHKDTEN